MVASDSYWLNALSWGGFGVVALLGIAFLISLAIFVPMIRRISELMTLAELEMIRLRNQGEGDKLIISAFVLMHLYAGDIKAAQNIVYNEIMNGGKPLVVSGLRQLLDFDQLDKRPNSGVPWFPLLLAVRLYGHPHDFLMMETVPTITSAPGSIILHLAEFLCTKKIYERVFLQAVLDMREEYNEALFSGQKEKARWVLIRGYLALAWTIILQLLVSVPAKIIKTIWT